MIRMPRSLWTVSLDTYIESTFKFFADGCTIFRKNIINKGMEEMQMDLNRLGEWAFENEMR
jgi:hypothetical protein